ncbi:hypothetical protein ASPVEDRAFT_57810 [Aspergillus versicolor CBS 583.65]|uniref:Major facilitator superfamily (MFS) profile domain-containing protein n=1 Tax=Aspergillus versicolor CBS 583.65 TaxID=1036611 RepID=A0A1L9Q564_ASPVE|nr:uncharacterized protein ASPVEDRAFT_57810 [Aspergillus versicolor CBS 583.65]OJJ08828.1 hypothetical protein ASPVEDRAFT_57810 [Aspergillus versicolor CBS 583.65]
MALRNLFTESTLATYIKQVRAAPRQLVWNRHLLLSTLCYATASMPLTWDQGSSGTIPILPGFQEHFGFGNSNAGELRYFVSIPFAGAGVGALLSLFVNDRIGRLWSWRLYTAIWIIGQLVMCFTPTLAGLWVARVICGLGIGPLTVVGTMSIVEIAPTEIRGLLAVWFSVLMCISGVVSIFTVLGAFVHIPTSRLQYQVVWFAPCVFFALLIGASFLLCESPRWLWLVGRHDEAVETLVQLRGLPADHPRVASELEEIKNAIDRETTHYEAGTSRLLGNVKETFTVRSNLRRVQQTLMSYALAQISGANSITSYFIPILNLLGEAGGTTHSLFMSGMYSTSKVFFTLIASLFLIDALGRRGSLFLGAFLQMVSDIYLAVYLKYEQAGNVNMTMSEAAIGMLFMHALGYGIGLFVLPYVFGGELWPNRIRSFGGAISQSFHWLFFFAMNFALPSLLTATNNWGAFLFFAACCLIAIFYVFFMVPETSGLGVEELDALFEGSWFNAYKYTRKRNHRLLLEGTDVERYDQE